MIEGRAERANEQHAPADHESEPADPARSFRARADPAPVASGGRVRELDGLRGVACLLVLAYHIKPHAVPGGWAAVDLFFVLSGYLITAIILKGAGGKRFLTNFYIRRGLRIWPIYYLTAFVLILASPLLPRPSDFTGLPFLLTYTQNIQRYWSNAAPEFTPYLSHTWSLAVEEQFYVLWPPLVCLVGRRGVIPLAVGLAVLSVGARVSGYHWWLLLARGDGLALGAILAAILPERGGMGGRLTLVRPVLGVAGVAAFVYIAALTAAGGMSTVGTPRWPGPTILAFNVLACAVVGLVVCNQGAALLRPLRGRVLVWLGTLSYGLYLYHYVMLLLADDLARWLGLGGRPFWREALTIAVIIGLAALSWRFVERPLLALKDRFAYAESSRPVPSRNHAVAASRTDRVREPT